MCEALARRVGEAGAERCWKEWQALVGETAGEGLGMIDPEALILGSVAFHGIERRLLDRLDWWALRGARLLSVQRMKSLAEHFPSDVRETRLPWFAGRAACGGDARWKRLAEGSGQAGFTAREGKGPKGIELVLPSTLLLRMRAGFGVGVKADLLACLLGIASVKGFRATAGELASTLAYSPASIRRASGEMVQGGFIRRTSSRPPVFAVDQQRWAGALDLEGEAPVWRFQGHALAFLAEGHVWAQSEELSAVVRASQARDLVLRFASLFDWLGLAVPSPARFGGAAYGAALENLVEKVIAEVMGG